MSHITINNEDCFITMSNMPEQSIDVVMTSPFYNTNKKQSSTKFKVTDCKPGSFPYYRYDTAIDRMSNDEYDAFTIRLFNNLDRVLKPNGTVLYNISYGNENTEGMFTAIYHIIRDTPFTVADVITWRKQKAMPNNCSKNRLTRICEWVIVFCRKSELKTFYANKPIASYRKSGQAMYSSVSNYVEARNNDGVCPYNKSTYSSELCCKLLKVYAPPASLVYDPFTGSGTTGVACIKLGLDFIGSEISEQQVEYARRRCSDTREELNV